ncbi:MAG TPA: NmrA family NAD(P)-binding protein [Galbitalea sp.]
MSVLVLGATGNVGKYVVAELAQSGTPTRVISRDSAKAQSVLPSGVEIIEGAFGDEKTIVAALDAVDSVFLLTPHAYTMADLQLRVIRAARRTGTRIVKLSGTDSAIHPDGPHACRQHWEIEEVLKASGQPFAILRPNSFMQVLVGQIMMGALNATGKIPNALAEHGISLIDARDVGAVSARVLTSTEWDGQTLVLTGPRSVRYADVAELVSSIRGVETPTVEVTPADVRASLVARGLEDWEADHFEEMYQLFRDGASEFVTDTVEKVTGRAPRTIEDYVSELSGVLQSVNA